MEVMVAVQGKSRGRLITTTKLFQQTPICALQASRAEGPRHNQNKRTDREIMRANDMHVRVLLYLISLICSNGQQRKPIAQSPITVLDRWTGGPVDGRDAEMRALARATPYLMRDEYSIQ